MKHIMKENDKKKFYLSRILSLFVLFVLGIFLSMGSLFFSSGSYGIAMYKSYFDNIWIFILNTLPIILGLYLLFYLTKRIWISFSFISLVVVVLTFINYFKVMFRDDTLLMEDLKLFFEMKNMIGQYKIELNLDMFIWIILIVLCSIGTYFLREISQNMNLKEQIVGVVIVLLVSIVFINNVLFNETYYEKTKNEELINRWGATQQFISRGFVYPFLYSSIDSKMKIPEDYNLREAKKVLDTLETDDIPENKKVNVIAIMLEAFADFSGYEQISFSQENNPYEEYKEIEKNSYYGKLITNIFAGGTVSTERRFITGADVLPSLRKNVPSYARYFDEQGYRVEGSHPCYQWFYNRININENLGFEKYDFYENRYSDLADGEIASDDILFAELYRDLMKSIDANQLYFNFSVTYQNHGPYGTADWYGIPYVENKKFYKDEEYNILNNYFGGIKSTGIELQKFINTIDSLESPTVVIAFGDHKPWLGDGNSVYEMLDIKFDLQTEEGIENYYSTPYFIHANNSAKSVLGNEFVGKGPTISPNYLMNEFFKLANWGGPSFMKVANQIKKYIPIVTNGIFYENRKYTNELSEEGQKKWDEYKNIEYYYLNDYSIE